jgi:hypothetical protein
LFDPPIDQWDRAAILTVWLSLCQVSRSLSRYAILVWIGGLCSFGICQSKWGNLGCPPIVRHRTFLLFTDVADGSFSTDPVGASLPSDVRSGLVQFVCRTSVSISSMRKTIALATSVQRRKLRKQFCGSLAHGHGLVRKRSKRCIAAKRRYGPQSDSDQPRRRPVAQSLYCTPMIAGGFH